MNHKISERRYYILSVESRSPISISNGISSETDLDVIRNGSGEVFVPGTSLAGAFRNYLNQGKKEAGIFGFSENKDGKMSSVHISDLYFESAESVSTRDGIRLDEQKHVVDKSKYDMEIIETGASGKIYIQFVKRDEDYDLNCIIYQMVKGINEGEIRIGASKTRGFGRLYVNKVYEKIFSMAEEASDALAEQWLAFVPKRKEVDEYREVDVLQYQDTFASQYIKLTIPLKQKGGISIRKYSTKPGEVDYEHMICNGKSVIPGSSWNGAIRAQIKKILQELAYAPMEQVNGLLQEWFGYEVDSKEPNRQSHIVIAESILQDGKRVPVFRNNINRFTAATATNMLYSEVACFDGHTELEIMVSKKYDYYKAVIGMLLLVAEDIQNGYVSIGGQAAIGRGIFEANGAITISEDISQAECRTALYEFLYEVK